MTHWNPQPDEDDGRPTTASSRPGRLSAGFTLAELLVVVAIIAIIPALLLPALSGSKAKAKQTQCAGQIRQIQLALQQYADDNGDQIPPRSQGAGLNWIHHLKPAIVNLQLLRCPSDVGVVTNSSYLLNGFIDWFLVHGFNGNWSQFFGTYKVGGFPSLKLADIPLPTETVTFGEKKQGSGLDPYMDMWPPEHGSDLTHAVDHAKHRGGGTGSNHAFADGSVRFLREGAAIRPKNLWAVTEQFRNTPSPAP